MRILTAIGWFLAGSIVMTAAILVSHKVGYIVVFPSAEQHVEILSLFLAAATLIITAVAIVVAIGAVVGYTALKDAATEAGRAAGDRAARELLSPIVYRERAAMTGGPPTDRTEELTTALSERDNDGGQPHN